jgi:NADH-quinone oxidoreductase subunit G
MIEIELDGQKVSVPEGSMVMHAAEAAGTYIPHFCYHKKLSIAANCRMCLVDVEKVAKPLPACATPVTDGMRVFTRSEKAVTAQKGVMEFLLINHPLDCPICDQGGECQLQDLAVGYGGDISRYREMKRVVADKDLGPLISTEMTRCIHCTRCVRFGEEVAGIMELGATGRGEHTRIGTYVERSVDSELSGNVIDLCPVGALTSKPFRYTARPWELASRPSIAPHDCVGSNVTVQVRRDRVMRVLPRENEAVNECWLADRDRFSYEGVNSDRRLLKPMRRVDGEWQETDWPTALEAVVTGLRDVVKRHGAKQLGALISPQATVEEHYLLQKLVRALGSHNVDHRLRTRDTSDDDIAPLYPSIGMPIAALEKLDVVLMVGGNVRKDQPLINHRLRKAALKGARMMAVNPVDYDFNYDLAARCIVSPDKLAATLGHIAMRLAERTGKPLPAEVKSWAAGKPGKDETRIADLLAEGTNAAVLVGSFVTQHPNAAVLRALSELVADLSGAKLGFLAEGNAAGAWLAGSVPHRAAGGQPVAAKGLNAHDMLATPLKAYVVFGAEPELDCWDPVNAVRALRAADFIVMFSAFQSDAARDYADVLLPLAPYTETDGSRVNAEGRLQAFDMVATPAGDSRPGWKILRVLGNLLGLAGFDQVTSEDVRREALPNGAPAAGTKLAQWRLAGTAPQVRDLARVADVPPYRIDPLVRHAGSLQQTRDNPGPVVALNAAEAERLGVTGKSRVRVRSAEADPM